MRELIILCAVPVAEPPAGNVGSPTEARSKRLVAIFESLVAQLVAENITFAAWLVFLFEPVRGALGTELRRKHFWHHGESVRQLLKHWTHSHQYEAGRNLVVDWMIDFVAARMRTEAQQITSEGILRSSNKTIGPDYLKSFKISDMKETLQERCRTSIKVLLSMVGVDESQTMMANAPKSAQNTVFCCLIVLLHELSQQNNLVQVVFSIYMYAAGLQRQAFEILAHLGLLVSYSFLVSGLGVRASWKRHGGKKRRDQGNRSDREPPVGPLKVLADGCIKQIQELVAAGYHIGFIFDNINFMVKVAEPVLGKIDAAINGTCATGFRVFGATDEALDQEKAHTAFLAAPPLELDDILLSEDETKLHHRLMVHAVLRLIILNAGSAFGQYMPLLEASQPTSEHLITLHQSQTYPLPAMEIDESSVDGTIKVMETIYATVGIDKMAESFKNQVQLTSGDLKSIWNLRAAKEARAGHDDPAHSFINITFIIGLFHLLMAAVTGFLSLHFGSPNAGIHNPGSLHFHNKLLERKPITITSPVPYTLAKNLIDVSLAARVIHCLTLESGCQSLEDYVKLLTNLDAKDNLQLSWKRLVEDAAKVYDKYTDVYVVEELRTDRKFAKPGEKKGDMVYENALLFMRDMLNVLEIRSAVKRGDPGCVLLIMKTFALSLQGAGRTHYAKEILYIIHHIEKVWPTPLRDVVLKNWLLNTTGRPNSWIGLDHHQEHGNLWIKTIYKAHGSNAAWSWIAAISPCVEALRALAKDLNGMLGRQLGSAHTSPDLSTDIVKVISSLKEHEVYQLKPGRTLHNEDKPIPDAESAGLNVLLDFKSGPLKDYNHSFKLTQEAYRRPVVSEMVPDLASQQRPSETQTGSSGVQVHGETEEGVSQEMPRLNINVAEIENGSEDDEDQEGLGGGGSEASEEEPEMQPEPGDIEFEDEDLAAMFPGMFDNDLIGNDDD
ncbi:hypothetical protein FRC08_005091 [Ceratobasidium sp. 394]|nr:hypothetical protein FRC08_005091 [Ceratobasidium sp. 394]